MCGISGYLSADIHETVDPKLLQAMGLRIAHRGPDGAGIYRGPGVGLVHRRLSIIDLASGSQPMGNEDNSIQIVFNGEIYNFRELRDWLIGRGHQFRTHCDTEVIVHGYEELGRDIVTKLRGMFAFAIWDEKKRHLLLARDRLGIKPLYIYRNQQQLWFASEPKAMLVDARVPREINVEALDQYLCFGMVVGPRSIFRGFEQLRPGHTLLVTPGNFQATPQCYWEPRFLPEERNEKDWLEETHAKVEEAVRTHLMADVPVGAFLSGGVDSSIVVSSMARQHTEEIETFSIGFAERDFSELPYAMEIAIRNGTRHTERIVTPDAVQMLEELTRYYDEPFGDTSAVPTFLVAKLAAERVKVVLSGDGADEVFGGYPRYAHDEMEEQVRQKIPRWLRRSLLNIAGQVWPRIDWLPRPLRLKSALMNLSVEAPNAYANSLAHCPLRIRRKLISSDVLPLLRHFDAKSSIRSDFRQVPRGDVVNGMLSVDTRVLLPDDYLVKVDRASMANGIEVRPPFLDHELVELALRMPASMKIRNGCGKYVLKEAYRRDLPHENVNRPKRGFNTPIDQWMRGALKEVFYDEVLNPSGPIGSLLHLPMARKMFEAHLSGSQQNGQVLWQILVLSHWANRYMQPPEDLSQIIDQQSQDVPLKVNRASILKAPKVSIPRQFQPIRIAFVVHLMQVAGAEVLIRETIRQLGQFIVPTIFCLDNIGSIGEELQRQGIPIVVLNRKAGRDYGVALRMAKEIRDRKIEVVHAHQYTPFFYSALAKLRNFGKFQLIQTEHGRHYPDIVSPVRRMINRLVLDRLANAVNACSHFSGKALSVIDGFRGDRLQVIDNGIDFARYQISTSKTDLRQQLNLPTDRKLIGCVARFHPVKDHAMLLRAFARVTNNDPTVDLVLIGDGEMRSHLEQQATRAGVRHRVHFLGIRKDIPQLMNALDIFSLTSVTEAASLTLLEAMASGLPVVVTNVGGNPELVRHDTDGFLVPRGDDSQCATAFEQLLRNHELAHQMGESGRQRVQELFTLERTVGQYFRLYCKLTGRKTPT
ncbi:MAG: asparagine synthase (glutamine-hydrolyzing) [Zavarzinella sp.]